MVNFQVPYRVGELRKIVTQMIPNTTKVIVRDEHGTLREVIGSDLKASTEHGHELTLFTREP